jgi:hypothetical protein
MIATFFKQVGNHTNLEFSLPLFRHMVFNTLRAYNKMYRKEYGEMIIACDSKHTWRRQLFPYYKASRKESREKSDIDWDNVNLCLNKIVDELAEHFPYRVINIEGAEADDVIATLTRHFQSEQKILILSADKDFIQLHTNKNVFQYDPVRKKKITVQDPSKFLFEHIIRGDRGDGIPNIYSADDVFVTKSKSKRITSINIDKWFFEDIQQFCNEPHIERNYQRNKQLIDLSMIPENLQQSIIDSYNNQANKKANMLFNYLINNGLNKLAENVGDFL